MIRDWDLWPWIIAGGAGPTSLETYRMSKSVEDLRAAIGVALYPTMRALARALR